MTDEREVVELQPDDIRLRLEYRHAQLLGRLVDRLLEKFGDGSMEARVVRLEGSVERIQSDITQMEQELKGLRETTNALKGQVDRMWTVGKTIVGILTLAAAVFGIFRYLI